MKLFIKIRWFLKDIIFIFLTEIILKVDRSGWPHQHLLK